MSEFFRTQMGQRFYEHTVPELVRQMARLNDNLERLIERLPARDELRPKPDEEVEQG